MGHMSRDYCDKWCVYLIVSVIDSQNLPFFSSWRFAVLSWHFAVFFYDIYHYGIFVLFVQTFLSDDDGWSLWAHIKNSWVNVCYTVELIQWITLVISQNLYLNFGIFMSELILELDKIAIDITLSLYVVTFIP